MTGARRDPWVLALYPFTRGIAFTFFHAPLSPLDWGIKRITGDRKNVRGFRIAQALIERYQPDAVVMGNCSDPHSRRSGRVCRLEQMIAGHVTARGYELHTFKREEIRACFKGVGAITRHEIAQAIASQVHALARHLPPVRQIWATEDARMSLFDAASLAMTFYCTASNEPGDIG